MDEESKSTTEGRREKEEGEMEGMDFCSCLTATTACRQE